jgi:hypothetical protein
VTLVDPQASLIMTISLIFVVLTRVTVCALQTQASFFACPATGQVSWDPPVGNFVYVLMPSLPRHFPDGDSAMQITAQRERRMVGDWRRIPWRYSILLSHKDWRDRMGKA